MSSPMSSNFTFLVQWPELKEAAQQAESLVKVNPRGACFFARFALECTVKTMYRIDKWLKEPYDSSLNALLHEPSFKNSLASGLFPKLKLIQKSGNTAAHSDRKLTEVDALQMVKELHHFLYWFGRTYSEQPVIDQVFDSGLITGKVLVDAQLALNTAKKLKAHEKKLELQDKKAAEKQAELERTNTELKAQLQAKSDELQAQIALIKAANAAKTDSHNYNEADTRKYLIDEYLKEAGWDLSKAEQVGNFEAEAKKAGVSFETQVEGMPNNKKIGFVDYVLWGEDGLPLAVVEAKRTSYPAGKGQQQAKLYGDCLEKIYGQRPILFYTNGYEIHLWDDLNYPERLVQGFYTRDQLQRLINRRTGRQSIANMAPEKDIAGRYYQEAAIKHIASTFEDHHQRKALLVMATGTGKTRTSIALVDNLLKQGWVKNILFLADRNALVTQAKKEFQKLLPRVSPAILSSGLSKAALKGRMYFSTYPTMMNILQEPADSRLFTVGHFDLVIIDEAHRSVYRKYRYIFDYFDSLLVGLTATPKDEVAKSTYEIFDMEPGVPTYAYELDQGVKDGYLVPPKAFSVPLKFMREGIKKHKDLTPEEQEEWDEKEALEDREEVLPSELNKFLYNKDTVDKMLKLLMEQGVKVEGNDTLGKTIIFAANNDHARFIHERFNHHYAKYKGHFARVITFKEDYAETLIEEFKKNEVETGQVPLRIAISVDMLDTGVDVPEVVNLVFFKVIRSKTKFMQMVGRGTRLSPELFGPNMTPEKENDKKYFKVFDYCQNFEFFEQNPEGAPDSDSKPIAQLIFEKRLELAEGLKPGPDDGRGISGEEWEGNTQVRDYLLSIIHHQVSGMALDNFIVRPHRKLVEKYQNKSIWQNLNKDQYSEVLSKLSSLPSNAEAFNDEEIDDELARRFDHLMLQMQLELLQKGVLPESLRLKVVETAEKLEAKSSIPKVAENLPLIQDLQTTEFWEHIQQQTLENVRRKLRTLIQFLDKGEKVIVYTNFQDEQGAVTEVEMPSVGIGLEQYRKKVQKFVLDNENQLTIARLKRGKAITALDLEKLDELLFEASGIPDRDQYRELIHPDKSLGVFIREMVGLDQQAAKGAFAEFLDTGSYNANQIEFINRVIEWLCQNGTMAPSALMEPPFSNMHDDGAFGFFSEEKVIAIADKLREINALAEPLQDVG